MVRPFSSHPAAGAQAPVEGHLAPVVGTADQVQSLEKRLIDEWSYPALMLMERAALAVVHFLEQTYPGAPVVVMAGTGNNAGDGLAVARLLFDRGHPVRVLLVGSTLGEAASRQMVWLGRRGLTPKTFGGSESFGAEWVLVDALFGIGLNRPLKSDAQLAIDWVNKHHWRGVVAVDVPSGLKADTGEPMGAAVVAHHTITLGMLKPGLLMDGALKYVGKLWLADIGFPRALAEPFAGRLNLPAALPEVAPDAHKGTLGTVMLVAGSATMSGAAILAARAACRSGVGLVYLGIVESQREMAAMAVPEAIVIPLPEEAGTIGPDALGPLAMQFGRIKALGVGPGLGHNERTKALVERLLTSYKGPVVLDADALPRLDAPLPTRAEPVVMTPHAGEMGRMFGVSAEEVQKDRLKFALDAAKRQQAVVVLKGARSLIARPDGSFAVNATGSPMLATAGSGDVLMGFMTGLIGRGMEPSAAAATAVYHHGRAAEAAKEAGMVSLVAGDLIEYLPRVMGIPPAPRQRLGDCQLVY